jgi:hypothetical protein
MKKSKTKSPALLVDAEHDLLRFTSAASSTRPALMGVHYNPQAGVLEASDGNVAVWLPVTQEGPSQESVIPVEIIKDAMQKVAGGLATVRIELSKIKQPICPFPDIAAYRSPNQPRFSIVIGAHILERIGAYARKHGHLERITGVRFLVVDEFSPITVEWENKSHRKVSGILMPQRDPNPLPKGGA